MLTKRANADVLELCEQVDSLIAKVKGLDTAIRSLQLEVVKQVSDVCISSNETGKRVLEQTILRGQRLARYHTQASVRYLSQELSVANKASQRPSQAI
eukprot:753605-Hanusia_phi.AAC.5